uniref:Small ribosomal subunit protein uS3c n=1 Tax=Pleodorina starrii TaxID=330485 RepID=M9P827_9CHLO|nr:ribosomal protein S3 [Pleodorina starrii]AFY64437.1 ribosomal protein S3 [Pleodorina starrii]
MGQKVHPLGFRVGITKKHQSQWFARFQKYGYSQSVFEDHMLRKTLLNLFSNLEKENALATKQSKKAGATQAKLAKITQIKIERGLIPYEIGIQIHSDDCLSITKAIDNIKVSSDLVSKLQKTRKYLFKVGTQLKKVQNITTVNANHDNQLNLDPIVTDKTKKRKYNIKFKDNKKRNLKFKRQSRATKPFFKTRRVKKLSKRVFMRLKNIKRRFKKRLSLKKRYLNLINKGLLMRKKGNLIIRNVKIKRKNKKSDKSTQAKLKYNNITKKGIVATQRAMTNNTRNFTDASIKISKQQKQLLQLGRRKPLTVIRSLFIYKKFANLFLTKLNKQFLLCLKGIMKYWHNKTAEGSLKQAPLGYNKKWYSAKSYALAKSLSKYSKGLASYQVEKLTKLIRILEKKSLVKMEALRKDFITFGTISKTRVFGYYQLITFLKQLKELVTKIKKQTIATAYGNVKQESFSVSNVTGSFSKKAKIQNLIRAKLKQKKSLTQKVVNKFINLVDKNQAMNIESRKIKWISYLKNLVNKHRTENLFYYLATIADARKDLKALKRYTKQHSNYLFGVNTQNGKENPNALLQRVTKTLTQSTKNPLTSHVEQEGSGSITKLQKAFLTQIENQRKMYKSNLALIPKISIKFFSVKTTDIFEKASIVADSIVDALEKRKAFRGVIKKAKEDLMRRRRVKGVKIQVSGRLNGAEIARSEWVRAGRVPLQTLRANIDYSYRTANTIYGIIGVKVWIFKGYSKIN